MPQLTQLLETVEVLDPQEVEGLQVFGLRWTPPRQSDYLTLDEALAAGQLEVTEVNDGGSVPTLRVRNRGDRYVFLMTGEQLVGAKQNRVLNADIFVDRQSDLPIPVSCVEQGRWRYRSQNFASGGTMSHSSLRKMMSRQTTSSYIETGTPRSDQGAVWKEVSRKLGAMNSRSDSQALAQVYEDHEDRLKQFLQSVQAPENCQGAAFVLRGKIAGVDLFDNLETLRKLWPKLLRSFALDALERREGPASRMSKEQVRDWLRTSTRAEAKAFQSPGLGTDVRLQSPELVGAGLVVEENPVHVELFVNDGAAAPA